MQILSLSPYGRHSLSSIGPVMNRVGYGHPQYDLQHL